MMNEENHDLEALKRDWQEGGAPDVDMRSLRRRLSHRWILVAFEALVILGVSALLIITAMDMHGVMEWIYWSFFAVFFVVVTFFAVRLRLKALHRADEGISAVLDHAWRDASVREAGGVFGLWSAPLVWSFVVVWLIADGLAKDLSLAMFLSENALPFGFVTVVCLLGVLFGALMREKGRRQRLELQRLVDELSGESSRG